MRLLLILVAHSLAWSYCFSCSMLLHILLLEVIVLLIQCCWTFSCSKLLFFIFDVISCFCLIYLFEVLVHSFAQCCCLFSSLLVLLVFLFCIIVSPLMWHWCLSFCSMLLLILLLNIIVLPLIQRVFYPFIWHYCSSQCILLFVSLFIFKNILDLWFVIIVHPPTCHCCLSFLKLVFSFFFVQVWEKE